MDPTFDQAHATNLSQYFLSRASSLLTSICYTHFLMFLITLCLSRLSFLLLLVPVLLQILLMIYLLMLSMIVTLMGLFIRFVICFFLFLEFVDLGFHLFVLRFFVLKNHFLIIFRCFILIITLLIILIIIFHFPSINMIFMRFQLYFNHFLNPIGNFTHSK